LAWLKGLSRVSIVSRVRVGLCNLCRDAADAVRVSALRVISVQVTALIVYLHLLAYDPDCRSAARIYKRDFSALGSVLTVFVIR